MKNILFDLDGTITDSQNGIINSTLYALEKYGIEVKDRNELKKFIGPPLAWMFSQYCGFSEEEGKKAVEIYREYYTVKGIFENEVYDGVEEMLKCLHERGANIYLATSKPQVFAKKILEHFGLAKYFDDIIGSELDGGRVEKNEVIACVLKKHGIKDAVMVGDRKFDIEGAKNNSLKAVGVLYGYGTKAELEQAGADFIADSVEDLNDYLIEYISADFANSSKSK